MLNKFIRILGIFIIIFISVISVFLSMTEREFIIEESKREWLSIPAFFEDRFLDYRMNKTIDQNEIDKRIVLLSIDDNSLKKIGRWPWSRTVWSDVMDKLDNFDAKVVAFDVFFSEPERPRDGIRPDKIFGESIKRFQQKEGRTVILPYSLNTLNTEFFKELPEELYNFLLDTKQDESLNLAPSYVSKTVWPVDELRTTEAMLGHIEAEADIDGVFRHIPLVANIDTLYIPSFALMAYQAYTGDTTSFEYINIGDARLKTKTGDAKVNYRGEVKVRWLGDSSKFQEISVKDLLAAKNSDKKIKELIQNNIVFVASTSFGAHDLRNTPVDSMLPGVYMHMNMTHMLLSGHFYKPSEESTLISWLLLIVLTVIMLMVQFFRHAIIDLTTALTLVIGAYILDTYYLIPLGYETKLFFCLFSVIACYSWTTFINFYLTNKDKAYLKQAFGNYISPALIDMMHKTGRPPKLGGEVGVRTAFFTDIQGFSTFSEKLSAEQLVELLNEYLTAMTDILLEEGGTLDKYEGDAIIAFFGAPMPLEDHAERACRVAGRMQNELKVLREKWQSEGDKWPEIVHNMKMRIGINTGEMVTGNMGSKSRMNYTMMGDTVNLAARLEEAAKHYGIFTQIGEETIKQIGEGFIYRELDTVLVVGKSEPVTTYDLIALKSDATKNDLKLREVFEKGLEFYHEQKWDEAIEKFQESLEYEHIRFPDLRDKLNPSQIYIVRSEKFKKSPPPADWDGVFTHTSKG